MHRACTVAVHVHVPCTYLGEVPLAVDEVDDERPEERPVSVGEQRGGRGGAAAALSGLAAEEEDGEGHVEQDGARHHHAQPLGDEAVARGRRWREAAQQVVTVDPVRDQAEEEAEAVECREGSAVDERDHHHLVDELQPRGEATWMAILSVAIVSLAIKRGHSKCSYSKYTCSRKAT